MKRQRSSVGLALVAAISFLAGMTDAIGLLALGDFVSFMSGNTTRASVAIADGDFVRAALLMGGLVAFILGNAAGVIVALKARLQAVLLCVTVILALAALVPHLHSARFLLLIFAMGNVNAAVEQIEGLPIGLTYVTGALSRFGRGLGRWIIGVRNTQWIIQIVPWSGMLVGAIAGSVLQRHAAPLALWAPFCVSAILTAAAVMIPRRWSRRLVQAHR